MLWSGRHSLRVFRPHSVKYYGVSRRLRVIGAHSGIYRLRMNPSGNAAVNSCVVAWRCGHLRSSRSSPARARRAVPARRHRYDTAIFSTGISSVYLGGVQRSEHAFVDGPVLNCAPLLVNALGGEGRLIQAWSKFIARDRRKRVSRGLPPVCPCGYRKPKPAVRC